ncbi:hypothetical protein B0S84_0009 [Caldicellulosiruptor bescii]|nr:hypothetical protein B0S84_0009 [Caldicellulosiruptor bescii]
MPLEKILINLDNIMNNHFNKKCYYYVHKVEDLSDIVNNMSKNYKTYIVAVIIEIIICFTIFYILRKNPGKSKRLFHYKKEEALIV